ncbi:fructose-6-phosphate aldolase [Lactiplantibacillus plantarum]|uniref:fructose-6-phosphate aldolase n=1 Tax=Lactiplantibacillus plantarum TaxID=1590 RepID=UPI00404603F0
MELLLDTVNLDTIKKYADVISLAGVTSNPSIVKKERPIDFYKHMREVRQIIGKERTLHVQVVGQTAEAMLADAHMILEELDDQVYIKVPTDMTGLAVIKQLKKEGIHVTATAIYSEFQGYLAIAAGVDYLAPYYNRMINMNIDSDYRGIERDINIIIPNHIRQKRNDTFTDSRPTTKCGNYSATLGLMLLENFLCDLPPPTQTKSCNPNTNKKLAALEFPMNSRND